MSTTKERRLRGEFRTKGLQAKQLLQDCRARAGDMMELVDWPLLSPGEHHAIGRAVEVPQSRRTSVAKREKRRKR